MSIEYECIECGKWCDSDDLCGECQAEYAGSYDYGDIRIANSNIIPDLTIEIPINPHNLFNPVGRAHNHSCDSCADLTELDGDN